MHPGEKTLIYVGAGGNIGSHAVRALARTGRLARMVLVDPDVYEQRNLASQDISARDVGRPKVAVMAERLRRIFPELEVTAIAAPVERVPLARLRADVIATGVDGLAARRTVNRAAWRLGVSWVDAGVRAEGLLARIDVFEPAAEAACFECAWSEAERAAVDNRYPCDPPAVSTPTAAPAWLGGLAAAWQTAECERLLAGEPHGGLRERQLLVDATTHRHTVSGRRRSPACAFDHARWPIRALRRLPGAISVGQALRLVPCPPGERTSLRLHGDVFVRQLECRRCPGSRAVHALDGRIDAARRACPLCGAPMVAPGMDVRDSLGLDELDGRSRRASLHSLGLRAGDVLSVETSTGEAHHFEIGGR